MAHRLFIELWSSVRNPGGRQADGARRRPPTGLASILVLAVSAQLPALASSQPARAEKSAAAMLDAGKVLREARDQVDSVLEALDGLMGGAGDDMVGGYKAFEKQVEKTASMANTVRKRASKASAQRDKYMKTLAKSLGKIQNEDLKQTLESRRKELSPLVESIPEDLKSIEKVFEPMLQDLEDIRLFLGNNLTPAGIASARPLADKCRESGRIVITSMDSASTAFDALAMRITPGAPR